MDRFFGCFRETRPRWDRRRKPFNAFLTFPYRKRAFGNKNFMMDRFAYFLAPPTLEICMNYQVLKSGER
jgi:hypothetical protein